MLWDEKTKATKEVKQEEKQQYAFPTLGVVVRATSLEEAQKLLPLKTND